MLNVQRNNTTITAANQSLVDEYLDWCEHKRGRSVGTLRAYRSALRAYVEWCGDRSVLDVSTAEMEDWVVRPRRGYTGSRARSTSGSAATQRRDAAILRSFYKWAWERNYTPLHVAAAVHGPTVHNENPRPIPDDHWRRLVTCTHRRKGGAPFIDAQAFAVLGLGFWCGLRRNELVDLRSHHWDGERIVGFVRKGGSQDTLDVAAVTQVYAQKLPQVTARLDEFLGIIAQLADTNRNGSMLGLCSVDAVNRLMNTVCKVAAVPRYTPHQLRHSAATNLLRAGTPLHLVQRIMNHSSPTVTMRYVAAGGSELREWLGGGANGYGQTT